MGITSKPQTEREKYWYERGQVKGSMTIGVSMMTDALRDHPADLEDKLAYLYREERKELERLEKKYAYKN